MDGQQPHQQFVTRSYGEAQNITVDGRSIYVRSRAEVRFFQELQLCIDAGEVAQWDYEPEAFQIRFTQSGCVCSDTYRPDAVVVWKDDRGTIYYEVKHGALDSKAARKIKGFCQQYPDKPLVLVWIGHLPQKGVVARRIDRLRPWLHHIWQMTPLRSR